MKQLGFHWFNKRWQRRVNVFPDYNDEHLILTIKANTKLVKLISEFEKMAASQI